MKLRFFGVFVFAATALIFYSSILFAHEFRPYFLNIREIGSGKYSLSYSEGALFQGETAPTPVFPAHCNVVQGSGGVLLDCGAVGLDGSIIEIQNLAQARVEAIVRYATAGGAVSTGVLRAGSSTFRVPGGSTSPLPKSSLFVDYIAAGADHILRGWDHLLFVLGLLLLVKNVRSLIGTITAFTIGHSVTLALASTGLVHVPQAPAEALIALSLMLLAAEIARPSPHTSIARERPWVMALFFGLLHGFGFAGALAEIGLPKGEIPLALFAFNAGVELGQLAFVFAATGIARFARRAHSLARARGFRVVGTNTNWSLRAPAYAIGALAAFWFIERIASLGS